MLVIVDQACAKLEHLHVQEPAGFPACFPSFLNSPVSLPAPCCNGLISSCCPLDPSGPVSKHLIKFEQVKQTSMQLGICERVCQLGHSFCYMKESGDLHCCWCLFQSLYVSSWGKLNRQAWLDFWSCDRSCRRQRWYWLVPPSGSGPASTHAEPAFWASRVSRKVMADNAVWELQISFEVFCSPDL